MSVLQTADLLGVEILAAGGPIHGRGSPPGGDHYRTEDLQAIERAHLDLAGQLTPPATIGHGSADPAVGWLENVRVNADGTKLLVDVRKVPAQLARLLEAGAYRTRSVELSKVTSQTTGKVYAQVITSLAWLGGRMPAVRTLADVVKLYETDGDVDVDRARAAVDAMGLPEQGAAAGHVLAAAAPETLLAILGRPTAFEDDAFRSDFQARYGFDPDTI